MRSIRHHLIAVALLILAAQGTGFLVPTGTCTCGSMQNTGCSCCKGGKMASGADCPMCKRVKHDDGARCKCSGRCGGHDGSLPWLVEIDAVLPVESASLAVPAGAAALPACWQSVLAAVRRPPSPPPKAGLS